MNTSSDALQMANTYIETHAGMVNQTFRHKLHLMPPIGWMNDPNGFCIYQGEYHLFYQYYPYGTFWGPMYWGHARSLDLISWEDMPVALAPGESYDREGVFSGSALVVNGELCLYYTGYTDTKQRREYDESLRKRLEPKVPECEETDITRQVQCLAVSSDGVHFNKYSNNPVAGSSLVPEHGRIEDFRDPKVWMHDGKYYMVCGSKSKDSIGQALFYTSDDGLNWQYLNGMSIQKDYGTAWECPDLFELGGSQVLIFSPQYKPRLGCSFENIHSVIAFIGNFNYSSGVFDIENIQELDQGFDFYAPQTIEGMDGSRILIAWMNMWERAYILSEENHGWNGSMTLPRKLTIRNKHIYQWPVDALQAYRHEAYNLHNSVIEGEWTCTEMNGNLADLDMSFTIMTGNTFEISYFTGASDRLLLTFDKSRDLVILNRAESARPVRSLNRADDFSRSFRMDCSGPIHLRAILDVSSLELFFHMGRFTMTGLFFPEESSRRIELRTEGKVRIHDLTKWNIRAGDRGNR